jgi:hypothetical protein
VLEHVPGKDHAAPDFMSRVGARHCEPDYLTFKRQENVYMQLQSTEDFTVQPNEPLFLSKAVWTKYQSQDIAIAKISVLLSLKENTKVRYFCLHNDLVCYKPPHSKLPPRVWVPAQLYYTIV